MSDFDTSIAPHLPELIALYREFRKVPDAGPLRADPTVPLEDTVFVSEEAGVAIRDMMEKLGESRAAKKGA